MTQDSKQLVLVVDDNPQNLQLMKAILSSNGYRVELASDGPLALKMIKYSPPDLILLDVRMPGMDGFEVCRQLKENEATQDIPVIFVTGMNDAEAETWGFALGGADYITKPFNLPVVLARVKIHLGQHQQHRSLEGMFRDVIEFAPDAFILADTAGVIVQINARAEQLFGYSREELVGQPVEVLIPQHLRNGHVELREGYVQQSHNMQMGAGLPCVRKDGTEFPGDINISPLQTHRGSLLMAVVRDASERKSREDQSQEAARYARSLIEVSLDPLVMIDTMGQITDVNLAAERITGLTRAQLIGSDAASKFTDPESLYRGFSQVVTKGQVFDYPMTIRHVSGRLTEVMCNANAYRDQQGEVIGVFASARDMTESRRIQQEILTSRQRVRELAAQSESVREEEKKHIAREVHDELGQVLTALRMDLSLLGMQSGSQDVVLMEKVQSMKGLVDRAIQGVRNVASNLRPSALDMGLVPAIEWQCGEFTKHTGVPCEFHADQASTDLDESWSMVIFRIVQESLTNITRYAQASSVKVSMERRDHSLWLEVCDDGHGFDPAQVAKKKSYGLLGMRERAIALGGRVKIVSAPGQGTLVDVTIPLNFDRDAKEFS